MNYPVSPLKEGHNWLDRNDATIEKAENGEHSAFHITRLFAGNKKEFLAASGALWTSTPTWSFPSREAAMSEVCKIGVRQKTIFLGCALSSASAISSPGYLRENAYHLILASARTAVGIAAAHNFLRITDGLPLDRRDQPAQAAFMMIVADADKLMRRALRWQENSLAPVELAGNIAHVAMAAAAATSAKFVTTKAGLLAGAKRQTVADSLDANAGHPVAGEVRITAAMLADAVGIEVRGVREKPDSIGLRDSKESTATGTFEFMGVEFEPAYYAIHKILEDGTQEWLADYLLLEDAVKAARLIREETNMIVSGVGIDAGRSLSVGS